MSGQCRLWQGVEDGQNVLDSGVAAILITLTINCCSDYGARLHAAVKLRQGVSSRKFDNLLIIKEVGQITIQHQIQHFQCDLN